MLLSIVVEVPIALALATRGPLRLRPSASGTPSRMDPPGGWRFVVTAVAVTLLTHPFAWEANARLPWPTGPRILAIEAVVSVVEGLLYARVAGAGWARGLLIGALANLASTLVGLCLL